MARLKASLVKSPLKFFSAIRKKLLSQEYMSPSRVFELSLGEDGYQGTVSIEQKYCLAILTVAQRFAHSSAPPKWRPREETKLYCRGWRPIEGCYCVLASYNVEHGYQEFEAIGFMGV